MAKVSDYVEAEESLTPNGGWLFVAELQDDGSYITKKIAPHNVGAVGPAGQQGPQGNQGADGAAGANGAAGTNGTNGTNAEMTRGSTTSVAVGTGSKVFNFSVIAANLGWAIGTRVRAASTGTP